MTPEQSHDAADPWAEFRVHAAGERLGLLREVRDLGVPVVLTAPGGAALGVTLWTVDSELQRLNFNAEAAAPQLAQLAEGDEAVAVAYLQSVKLQFELHAFTLVRGLDSMVLQCRMPAEIFRFQRRSAFRVRANERAQAAPAALLRHPALPDMQLTLRVLDISIGGCALWLPHDVPALQPGTLLGEVHVALDAQTRFAAGLRLQHAGTLGVQGEGVRLGCEWAALLPSAQRMLQRWIDRAQQRHRVLQSSVAAS